MFRTKQHLINDILFKIVLTLYKVIIIFLKNEFSLAASDISRLTGNSD